MRNITQRTLLRSALTILAACTLLPGAHAANNRPAHDGSLGDPNILYVGRWDRSDSADYHGYWSNVYLRTRFTGTSVGIKLDGGTRLDVSIDNEPYREMDAGPGVTALNTAPLDPASTRCWSARRARTTRSASRA